MHFITLLGGLLHRKAFVDIVFYFLFGILTTVFFFPLYSDMGLSANLL